MITSTITIMVAYHHHRCILCHMAGSLQVWRKRATCWAWVRLATLCRQTSCHHTSIKPTIKCINSKIRKMWEHSNECDQAYRTYDILVFLCFVLFLPLVLSRSTLLSAKLHLRSLFPSTYTSRSTAYDLKTMQGYPNLESVVFRSFWYVSLCVSATSPSLLSKEVSV